VIGCTIRPVIAARDRSLEELIYDTAQLALTDAGITIDDVDGIVVASNDQFDGRSISVMMASGPVGGVDRDIMSTPSASEHAFILGALRVAPRYRHRLSVLKGGFTAVQQLLHDERRSRPDEPLDELRMRSANRRFRHTAILHDDAQPALLSAPDRGVRLREGRRGLRRLRVRHVQACQAAFVSGSGGFTA
jgi:hypothetical protein